jgi:hypothetical protein
VSLKRLSLFVVLLCALLSSVHAEEKPRSVSGIYPTLAMFNNEGECGTGAVVPWAGKLWVITYGPHLPNGSSDKLYEISPALEQTVRPESIGGTPANRMIHRESKQLFIGPYAIDEKGGVRAIPYSAMPGRHTGNARHLTDPANKIYYGTMEEGFYEVDVHTLEVKELYRDANSTKDKGGTLLPGYHGKGLYSAQGRLVYANNGERTQLAQTKPDITSGCLAEWSGADWTVVRRNQFTEVTGPGGIEGNAHSGDPLWSIGWDHRSLILMLLDGGTWHSFRLPKASHCYDGAHGWNTEWPRIRDIGEKDLLMTMHGSFWKFPRTFSLANTAGIAPRSTYLKVIGDFCKWNDSLVIGCDDSAKSEFLNKRKVKGGVAGPGQSQSNLWFIAPETLDALGGPLGRGAVWENDAVKSGVPSDPFLFSGFAQRGLHLSHDNDSDVSFTLEVDAAGNGQWKTLRETSVPAHGYTWVEFPPDEQGAWIRIKAGSDVAKATAFFQYASPRTPPAAAAEIFTGIPKLDARDVNAGLVLTRGENLRTLGFASQTVRDGKVAEEAFYELDANLKLKRVDDAKALEFVKKKVAIPEGVVSADAASVLVVDDQERRWRLPKGDAGNESTVLTMRPDREVCTERDLFNAHGTFYELPADNAGGFAKIRPISTHNRLIHDYCSYRGMMVLTGLSPDAAESANIVRSDDGKASLWVGAVDDLWKFGKPVGQGGPWKETAVKANAPSDAYLIAGYDRKSVTLSHNGDANVGVRIEVDISGNGDWKLWRTIDVPAKETVKQTFPQAFNAYWVRTVADKDCTATAWFVYE